VVDDEQAAIGGALERNEAEEVAIVAELAGLLGGGLGLGSKSGASGKIGSPHRIRMSAS
jgi:hypothetical protein